MKFGYTTFWLAEAECSGIDAMRVLLVEDELRLAENTAVALLITRTTFNIASFMGLIMVIGIVAKNGILPLDADEKFRSA